MPHFLLRCRLPSIKPPKLFPLQTPFSTSSHTLYHNKQFGGSYERFNKWLRLRQC